MNPFKASLLAILSGWLIGFLSIFPVALLQGRLSSHEFLVGEVEVHKRIPNDGGWIDFVPTGYIDPEGRKALPSPIPSEEIRIVFVGELIQLYDPRPSLDEILFRWDGQPNCRFCNTLWRGQLFASRKWGVSYILTPRIDQLLAREGLPSEMMVASMLLASLDKANSQGSQAALALQFGAPSAPILLGTRSHDGLGDFEFRTLSSDESERLRKAAEQTERGERLTPPPAVWPVRVDPESHPERPYGPRPIVLMREDLRPGTLRYTSAWSSVFRKGTTGYFAKVGFIISALSLLGFWGYRWRGGILRAVRRSVSGVSSRASSIDKFMSDPSSHDEPQSHHTDEAQRCIALPCSSQRVRARIVCDVRAQIE